MMGMREKLIELVNDVLNYLPWGEISSHTAKEIADHLIANGVTIPVRCKDCKYFGKAGGLFDYSYCSQSYECDGTHSVAYADDFCSYGERRTDEAL